MGGDFRKVLNRGGWVSFRRECYSRCFRGKRILRSNRGVSWLWIDSLRSGSYHRNRGSRQFSLWIDLRRRHTWWENRRDLTGLDPNSGSIIAWNLKSRPLALHYRASYEVGHMVTRSWTQRRRSRKRSLRMWHALLRENYSFKVWILE